MDVPPIVEEATRRSAVCWVEVEGHPPLAAWHVWHDGAAHVVVGGREQDLPGLAEAEQVVVLVRSKDRQGDRVADWHAVVEVVAPGSARWDEVVPLLHAARQSPPDGDGQPERWARESVVLRLVPTGELRPV